jgi:hypothetical protein
VKPNLAELEVIVRDTVCGVCSDRTASGDCGLEDRSGCALFRLFPQVAKAIQSVNSDDIQPYVDAIRAEVCSVCTDHAADGSCETRRQVRCALDAYLLLVVDAIEAATGKKFDRSGIGAGAGANIRPAVEIQF